MLTYLADKLTTRIIEDASLPMLPRLRIRTETVVVGPYTSKEESNKHYQSTVGSGGGFVGTHEFRFGKQTHILESVIMLPPPHNSDTGWHFDIWKTVPFKSGLLQLVDPLSFFELMPFEMEMGLEDNGEVLICTTSSSVSETGLRLRLRIAPDFDLLFFEDHFCGWMLTDPLGYIVEDYQMPKPMQRDDELMSVVKEYLRITGTSYFDRVYEEDTELLQALLKLRYQLKTRHSISAQREAVISAIEDILDLWYDNWQSKVV